LVKVHVSDFSEDVIALIGEAQLKEGIGVLVVPLCLDWIDDLVRDACVA